MLNNNNSDFQAVRITVSGDVERISLDRARLLQSLYGALDCRYVEVVQPTDTICLRVDEEGLLNRSDPNLLATLVAAELGSFPQVLRGKGIDVARCTVERLMKTLGLQGARRGKVKRTTTPDPAATRAQDLVKRDFCPLAPNKLWVS